MHPENAYYKELFRNINLENQTRMSTCFFKAYRPAKPFHDYAILVYLKKQGRLLSPALYLFVYMMGSMPRAGWPFSERNSTSSAESVVMVSSAIISVKFSMP